jgi:hypothetical protein
VAVTRQFSREEHEQGLALFLARQHRPRYLDSLTDEKLRQKLRGRLAHFDWLDERCVERVDTTSPEDMARGLRVEGAPQTCVVVSEDHDLDGSEMALEEALRSVLHDDDGALISCVPGRLAIYSDEAPNKTTLILRRSAAA